MWSSCVWTSLYQAFGEGELAGKKNSLAKQQHSDVFKVKFAKGFGGMSTCNLWLDKPALNFC